MEEFRLFSLQSNCVNFETYKNEFETMSCLFHRMPAETKKYVWGLSVQYLQNLEEVRNQEYDFKKDSEKREESNCLRQQGNRLFTAKGSEQNILGACRLYTDAIYAALDIKGEELAYGFANRATALQAFGYYKQAYDDCVCALKLGYPQLLRHKIITRQALCSIKMLDLEKAEQHLNVLKELTLNARCSQELEDLLKAFDELKLDMANKKVDLNKDMETQFKSQTQEVITTKNGRYLEAKCQIEKNQLIFTEEASAFVLVGNNRLLCSQCATVNFIPIPCLDCRGEVSYCSLKCQEKHTVIHAYECSGYRMQLFARMGIAHLALRIVLDNGLFSILDELKLESKTSTHEVWLSLTAGGDIWKNNAIRYSESLRMITHLSKMPLTQIEYYALISYHLVVYLKHKTNYFETLNARNKNIDWEHLTGSLILLHIGHMISNGHAALTLIPQPLTETTTTNFHMLDENIWSSPWHIKLGYLHLFANYDVVAAMNFPYTSLCNHSCVPAFQTKFSGRFISTYALRSIKKGEEITNCYHLDYRKQTREARRQQLRESYYFECQCENCLQTDSKDVEFNAFRQYRCDNIKCGQIFIPEEPTYKLFENDFANIETLCCSICGYKQTFTWCEEVPRLLSALSSTKARHQLYQIFKKSQKYLLDLNNDRCILAHKIIEECFKLQWINCHLNDTDYSDLVEMIKYVLNVMRKQNSLNSIPYVSQMVYLWDLIAKRKYMCSKADMEEMLWALSIISDDCKIIFLNYYNDYIKQN